jgi:hypothetical protein
LTTSTQMNTGEKSLHSAGAVLELLRSALAGGPKSVSELEEMARASGLLGERQSITHARRFKQAKKFLGIQSIRSGFASKGAWIWQLEEVAPAPKDERSVATDPIAGPATRADPQTKQSIPPDWETGVASLKHDHPPADVPPHRWRLFIEDCHKFLASEWASRAAELGWDAKALFGCHRLRPLMYLGSAGLMWDISGGELVQLHRESLAIIDQRTCPPSSPTVLWREVASPRGRCGSGTSVPALPTKVRFVLR